MPFTLHEIAAHVGGQLHGDGNLLIHGANIIRDAAPGEITLAEGDKAQKQLATCQASAVIAGKLATPPALPYIQVDHLATAFAKVVELFRPRRRPRQPQPAISPATRISPSAQIAAGATIHASVTIEDDVVIEPGVTIHGGTVIMAGCQIGRDTTIYPNVVLYENTIVGHHCILHAGCVLGAHGFGYSVENGRHVPSPQLGYVELAPFVEVGAGTTIDRGTYGATYIGEGTKIDNLVMIAHNCRIGRHNLICSQVGIAGSSTTGDYVVLAGQVGLRDHIHIGDRAQIGAKGGVMNDVPPGATFVGIPATPEKEYFQSLFGFARLPEMRKEFKKLQQAVAELQGRVGDAGPSREAA
jgi:UDP-3-O-[3-hydroxymyristoyl] glucosamine N-acyltransferase